MKLEPTVKNVLIISKDNTHIDYLTKFLNQEKCITYLADISQLNTDPFQTIRKIDELTQKISIHLVTVHSDIFNYKLDKLPNFLSLLRQAVGQIQITLLHPNKVHPEDRNAIAKAVEEPFKALQGHDLDLDPQSDLSFFFSPLIKVPSCLN